MPFYDLEPKEITLRSKFHTSYPSSTDERKSNIKLAAKSIDKTFIDVGGEFSFNRVVGERTEKRGYKPAKIIVGGEFVDGVGGGVCQVSSTLYNAALLGGMTIIEYHPHSLPVSYVAPSFDAMVNSSYADLKFVNDTHNPIIIFAHATDSTITIEIYGEPMTSTFERKSVTVGEIPPPKEQEIFDTENQYPDLYQGQSKVVRYSKAGLMSEGYLIEKQNGKIIRNRKIRTDKYNAVKGLIVHGTAEKQEIIDDKNQLPYPDFEMVEIIYRKLLEKFLNNKKIL